ncbi:hypothetical protein [Sphingomonas lenta]|uniref:hypothetical protein n=1 Tax=Sphingomonas lenta TaxID=1141887 RepID=UPI000BB385DC|nr:hypothetical protein [Sphingomonas lenta]
MHALALAVGVPAQLPAPFWRGVETLAIECALPSELVPCADLVREVRRGAPMAVAAWPTGAGGRELTGTVILSVALAADGPERALTLSARRAAAFDESQGELLPRRFAWCAPAGRRACAAAVARALDQVLPWRARRGFDILPITKGEKL